MKYNHISRCKVDNGVSKYLCQASDLMQLDGSCMECCTKSISMSTKYGNWPSDDMVSSLSCIYSYIS